MKEKHFFGRHSATILTCLGAVGVVATAVTAVQATPKALKLIENKSYEYDEELTPVEIVRTTWKCYIPAIMIGTGTILCIVSANKLNKRQQASLISAYTLLHTTYENYKKKMKDVYGENADATVREEMAKEEYRECYIEPDAGKQLFFDFFSGQYFERTMEEVIDAEYQLNRKFALEDYVGLNEYYELLGLDPVTFGDALGWSIGAGENFYNYKWIDFEHELVKMDDGLECYIIHMLYPPTADFMDYC